MGRKVDFTSSLYLGLLHASSQLASWPQLTTGVPSAVRSPPVAHRVAADVARLQGCERGELRRSTLHAVWDVFGALALGAPAVLIDAGSYRVLGWGAERARSLGVPTRRFAHHDPADLARQLQRVQWRRGRPVVVCDGFCPGCGGPAPLLAYHELVRAHQGFLLLDDSQALGLLGQRPGPEAPYGTGGGGMLAQAGLSGADVLAVSSLAKAFGAPLAAIVGNADVLDRVASRSETTVYSSPPSSADLHAAAAALAANRADGDRRRRRLAALVARLRRRVAELGLGLLGGSFPVQSLVVTNVRGALAIHRRLAHHGIRTVAQRPRCRPGIHVTFVITARHELAEIDQAARALAAAASSVLTPAERGQRPPTVTT